MRAVLVLVLVASVAVVSSSCNECAGTPSCHDWPQVSATGQFVVHGTDDAIAGVSVTFVRQSGVAFANSDSTQAATDAKGFFVLHAPTLQPGSVTGELHIVPPGPYMAFTIPNITLQTSPVRGDGANLGRLAVNPYIFTFGHIYDRNTGNPVPNVRLTIRRLSGGVVSPNPARTTADAYGNFPWAPTFVQIAPVVAQFDMTAAGYPRTFSVVRNVPPLINESGYSYLTMPLGFGLSYSGGTLRRGTFQTLPGVRVQFVRVSGIATQPDQTLLNVDANGSFPISVQPLEEGTLKAEIRVYPSAPFQPETTLVTLHTTDDDVVQSIGSINFGAQLFLTGTVAFADSNNIVPAGSLVRFRNVSGVSLAYAQAPGDTIAATDAQGHFFFRAPTADSGSAHFDVIVQLPQPFEWDTLPGFSAPARFSDSAATLGAVKVRRRITP